MKLTSTAFEHNGLIPTTYTCDGENVNPPLQIDSIPNDAVSLVLIMDDPDVPKHIRPDGVWDHWIVYNISPNTRKILEGQEPEGTLGNNTSNAVGYQGPCPPDRQHRYIFKLYALDTMLALEKGATKHEVEHAMKGHVLNQAELIGLYKRHQAEQ